MIDRPWITLKAGVSLDGRIAAEDGQSQWITGPAARAAGHVLRSEHDAVMVGTGTLLADDPSLNTRVEGGRDAVPVVLDRLGRCPSGARVLAAGRRPVFLTARPAALAQLPVDVVEIAEADGLLDLAQGLAALASRGIQRVLVEGGGRLHRSLLALGVVDAIELFVAPVVLAGGPAWVGGPGYTLADSPRFRVHATRVVGDDVHLSLRRREA